MDARPGIRDYERLVPDSAPGGRRIDPTSEHWGWRDHSVRVLRRAAPDAPVRLIVVHGAGGHSEALWPIADRVAGDHVELAAVDLPLYGDTISPDARGVRYEHWVKLLQDFVAAEQDGRPVILFGASIGGMLAYEVAATTPSVNHVVATCLLDPNDPTVLSRITRFGSLARLATPVLPHLPPSLARRRIPVSLVAPLNRMSRDPRLSRLCATDPRGGGSRVPVGFLASWMSHRPSAPELMTTPVTLAHPELDAWTPRELSLRFFDRIAAPTRNVVLRDSGHFPIEQRGLRDLAAAIDETVDSLT